MKGKIIHSAPLFDALQKAGILPDNCVRVVIDISIETCAHLYFECLGDERLLEVISSGNGIKVVTE